MSHNNNRNNTIAATQARYMDARTNQPSLGRLGDDYYDDAPQTVKQVAASSEHITVEHDANGQAVLVIDLKKLRPTKSGTGDLYATGTIKLANGVSVSVNITRPYEARTGTVKCENGKVALIGLTSMRITLTTNQALRPASTGKSNLHALVNGKIEVGTRGWFNVSCNAYKSLGK